MRRLRMLLDRDGWVAPYFARYRTALFASLGLGALALVFASMLMFTSGYLIDLAAERPEQGVWALFVPLAFVQIFGIGKPFFGYFERLKSHDWVLHMSSELRRRLYRSIEAGGMFWTATHGAGKALGLLSEDIGHLQDLYLRSIFPQVIACIVWLALSAALGLFSPLLGALTLLVVGVLVFVVPIVSVLVDGARQSRRAAIDARLYSEVYDNVSGLSDWVFAQRGEEYVERVMDVQRDKAAALHASGVSARRRDLFVQLVICLACAGLAAWAALHFGAAAQDAAGAGSTVRPADWVAAFVLGFFPLAEAFVPLGAGAVQAHAQADSVQRLNDASPTGKPGRRPSASGAGCEAFTGEQEVARERDKAPQPLAGSQRRSRSGTGGLLLRDVHFAYPGQRGEILKGIDLSVAPGEWVALLGPSGAGKSTLLSVLRADVQPTAGSVLLDGTPPAAYADAIAEYVSVIQQDSYLFDQTLLENLALEDESVTEKRAREALVRVGLGPLLDTLPEGLHTFVGEAGEHFSGGETQRIALARVLLRDTPVVLLDEPTVSLDPATESALLKTMFEVLEGRTVIMVTHHLMGASRANRVVFLDEGIVAMEGAPAHLARTNERYRQLLALDCGGLFF